MEGSWRDLGVRVGIIGGGLGFEDTGGIQSLGGSSLRHENREDSEPATEEA